MNVDAVVYTSAAGHTKQYSELLAKKLGLPCYTLPEAKGKLAKGTSIIYLGWVRQGMITDYYKARKKYQVEAAIGVGMGIEDQAVTEGIAQKTGVKEGTKVFYLQGGFDFNLLKGRNKFIMKQFRKTMIVSYSDRKDLSDTELAWLKMIRDGGNVVGIDRLAPVLEWIKDAE